MFSTMYYSPEQHIPVFKVIMTDDGKKLAEFKNGRTGKTEVVSLREFIRQLIHLLLSDWGARPHGVKKDGKPSTDAIGRETDPAGEKKNQSIT